jgi:hypothetical protein
MSNTSKSSPVIIKMSDWNPSAKKYMTPKLNDKGGKSINVISNQTNRSIHLTLPLMMTWGISDYTDEKTGESDGKYSMQLNFPNSEYATNETNIALQKLKDFEEQLIVDAVANSEVWFGKKQSREIVEYGFFPFLKYPKNKDTKATDYTRSPSIRPKVPKYGEDWKVEVYDTKMNLLFPSPKLASPIDLVPKQSNVASVIACGGIWIGGKGWGLTWKLIQCVVKPQIMENVFGKCHIQLSEEEVETIEQKPEKKEAAIVPASYTEDSDDDFEPISVPAPKVEVSVPVPVPAPKVEVSVPVSVPKVEVSVPTPKVEVSVPDEEEAVETEEVAAPKKKIIKKIVKKSSV